MHPNRWFGEGDSKERQRNSADKGGHQAMSCRLNRCSTDLPFLFNQPLFYRKESLALAVMNRQEDDIRRHSVNRGGRPFVDKEFQYQLDQVCI